MFETARAAADGPFASAGGARVNSHWHAELTGSRCQRFDLVVEPRYSGGIITSAKIATRVRCLDPVAAEGAAQERSDAAGIVGNRINRQRPTRGIETVKIPVSGIICAATKSRGPATKPELNALRRSIVGNSGSTLPRSRKVVNP